jgi:probable HAF family extracellular repeat protein
MQDLGTLAGGAVSQGDAINDKGQVTGTAYTVGNAEPHAFLWNGSAMLDLNKIVQPLQPHVTLMLGIAINNRGQILADGYDSNLNQTHAYLVSPTPPGTTTTIEGVSPVGP